MGRCGGSTYLQLQLLLLLLLASACPKCIAPGWKGAPCFMSHPERSGLCQNSTSSYVALRVLKKPAMAFRRMGVGGEAEGEEGGGAVLGCAWMLMQPAREPSMASGTQKACRGADLQVNLLPCIRHVASMHAQARTALPEVQGQTRGMRRHEP